MDFGADGIAEDDGAGWTCRRSISDWYLTSGKDVDTCLLSSTLVGTCVHLVNLLLM